VTGDSYSFVLGAPIDPSDPNSLLNMGVGIGDSAQGTTQYSQIDVNGARLTTSAGGQDDGALSNGALITVGGIGDVNTNPSPYVLPSDTRTDDELYSLLPFITNTVTNITVATLNTSLDDNIFMSYFELTGSAIILNGAGIVLAQSTSSGCLNTTHTVTATVVDGQSVPLSNVNVDFTVISGPNSGATGSAFTNGSGQASFTYTGSGGVGTDQIQACFSLVSEPQICSNILNFQWTDCQVCIPTLSQWGLIILALLFLAAEMVYLRRRQYSFATAGGAEVSEKKASLFNSRSYFMILAVLLGIAVAVFSAELLLSVSIPARDIMGAVISSAILAYILQLFNTFRK
jgi:hypothetical protein